VTARLAEVRRRLVVVYAGLAVANLGAWAWAFVAFQGRPALLGIALMVYGLGLRHAVDADHIAAIDNVTRKLMQQGQRPVAVCFFFAIGHSLVVTLVAAAVSGAAHLLARFDAFRALGGFIGAGVSALFLLAIAAVNLVIFVSIWRAWRRVRAGGAYVEADADALLGGRGLLSRLFRPLFRLVDRSWHMLLLGFLFGLGFDTASEVAMCGVSATQLAHGLSFGAILAFPALFAAGMSLIDTTDGVMMLGAYEWAFVRPLRKLTYNMIITAASAVVALVIGGLEVLGLAGELAHADGGAWPAIAALNGHLGELGFAIIALFALAWGVSVLVYRLSGLRRSQLRLESAD
jgi:nickel/cobalt transporter (NiCoT) family protein